jgi:hypothetical protein
MLSKVPEVTVWFWIIKILCTTVGESFADWINVGLGVGLGTTAIIFTIALGLTLAVQLWLTRDFAKRNQDHLDGPCVESFPAHGLANLDQRCGERSGWEPAVDEVVTLALSP